MDLATANRVIEGCIAEAQNVGRPFSIVVVDEGGHVVSLQRMDGANFLSHRIAQGKAYACAGFRRDGPQLQQMTANPSFLAALVEMTQGQFVASQGACRIMDGERLIGAVGVSGAAPEQDQQVAEAGVRALGR
jgi:uncharacterized protein GlcG (DUF336 family)